MQTSGLADEVGSLELDRLNVLCELLSRSGPFVLPKDSVQTDYLSRVTSLSLQEEWALCEARRVGAKHRRVLDVQGQITQAHRFPAKEGQSNCQSAP